jgi:hypothetical protein
MKDATVSALLAMDDGFPFSVTRASAAVELMWRETQQFVTEDSHVQLCT